MCALSNIKMARQDVKILEYSPVVKIAESNGLLVQHCSARLGEYGLTLWVVSILMYDQEFHHKKIVFFFVLCLMPRGSRQGAHGSQQTSSSPKVSYLYDQEHNVVYTQEF